MTAEEIREVWSAGKVRDFQFVGKDQERNFFLAEIAAQLAELNQRIGGGSGSLG